MADQPGYTRIPNAILDAMPTMPDAERRVVLAITRKTAGWQKRSDKLSITQLETLTGLSRPAVVKATKDAAAHGWIERVADGDSFAYQLTDELWSQTRIGEPSEPQVVNSVNYQEGLSQATSKVRQLELVNSDNQEVVNSVNTQKESIKEKKERVSAPRKSAGAKPDKPEEESTPTTIVQALADACTIDRGMATKRQHIQLAQVAKIICKSGRGKAQSDDQIVDAIKYVAGWWYLNDWRGRKGQPPKPSELQEIWPQAIAAKTNGGAANGRRNTNIRQNTGGVFERAVWTFEGADESTLPT